MGGDGFDEGFAAFFEGYVAPAFGFDGWCWPGVDAVVEVGVYMLYISVRIRVWGDWGIDNGNWERELTLSASFIPLVF